MINYYKKNLFKLYKSLVRHGYYEFARDILTAIRLKNSFRTCYKILYSHFINDADFNNVFMKILNSEGNIYLLTLMDI